MADFDVVVIGAGPGGEVCAGRLTEGGLRVAIAEERLVGGECGFYGCIPSKALLRPGQALGEAQRVQGARQGAPGPLDAAAALAFRDWAIAGEDDAGQLPWLEEHGIELLRGRARLAGERRVVVGDRAIEAGTAVVLAAGTEPLLPPVEGLPEAAPWTNREATTAGAVPGRLVVLGGGSVGAELAQAWQGLGARVVLLEGAPRVLAHEEPFAGDQVAEGLRRAGVEVRTGVRAARVERSDGGVRVMLEDGGAVEGDELLVATGRRAVTDRLGLDAIGLEAGRAVEVGDDLRVPGHPWLHAIGDVNGRAPWTHMAKEQGRLTADRILGRRDAIERLSGGRSPRVTFTEPQVAAVGHTLASAEQAGLRVRAVDVATDGTAGGMYTGRGVGGTSRLVVDEDARVVAGATFVGAEVAEWLHAATIAVSARVPLDDLWAAVPAFPTRSEVWLQLLEAYGM